MSAPMANPLTLYLRAEQAAIQDILRDLRDAQADMMRTINRLETKSGIGSQVRRAQLAMIRRELLKVQTELWVEIGKRIRAAGPDIADAAAEAEAQMERFLFRTAGLASPGPLIAAQQAYAERTVANYLSRRTNNISLSERVYRSKALAAGWVDRAVNRVIVSGGSWRDIAKAVRPMIDPDVPGGVSYAAKRLARTELNNAFHATQQRLAEVNPFVVSVQWHLSRSHPKKDKCDDLASGHSAGLKKGHYRKGSVPSKPHPQCLCFTTSVPLGENDFLKQFSMTDLDNITKKYGGTAARSA
jgi:hypothetical protein